MASAGLATVGMGPGRVSLLTRVFDVRPGEGRLVLLLGLFAFMVTVAAVMTQAVGFGLFLGSFGSQALPYSYMAMAVAASFIAFAYLQLAGRLSLDRLLAINLSFLVVGNAVLRLGLLTSHPTWLLFMLPVWFQVLINLGNLAIWALAGRIFDVQQGKRLFGLVNAGYWLAFVIGGFLVPLLVTRFGVDNLLLVAGGAAFAALGVERLITRLCGERIAAAVERATAGRSPAESDPAARQYVRLIFALTLCLWVGFFIVDNIFYNRAAIQFPHADRLAGVVGVLGAAEGILALLVTAPSPARSPGAGWPISRHLAERALLFCAESWRARTRRLSSTHGGSSSRSPTPHWGAPCSP